MKAKPGYQSQGSLLLQPAPLASGCEASLGHIDCWHHLPLLQIFTFLE